MLTRTLICLGLIVLLLTGVSTSTMAQGAPDIINNAVSSLSTLVGRALTLDELENWSWNQQTFSDASLGCPEEGQMYAQQLITGYQFLLTTGGVEYDYRVSGDGTITRLCGQRDASEADADAADADDYSNVLCQPPAEGEPAYMRSILTVDIQARVVMGSASFLRDQPSQDGTQISTMPGEAIFSVIAGPSCDRGIVWWQVDFDGQIGWTAEGAEGEYFVEVIPPNPLPVRIPVTADNAALLNSFGRFEGNFGPAMEWTPDGERLLVAGATGSEALWIFMADMLEAGPRFLTGDSSIRTIISSYDGQQALIGTEAGAVHFWNLPVNAPLVESLFLQTHQSSVASVAASPDGTRFASAGIEALTTASVTKTNAILLWDIASVSQIGVLPDHSASVSDLAFSPDGTQLASVAGDSSLRIWDGSSGAPINALSLSSIASALTYSSNGQFIALALADGSVQLIDATTYAPVVTYTGHLNAVTSLAFSPDNTLLFSGSEDGTVRVWNTQSDTALAVLEAASDSEVMALALHPDGDLLAVMSRDHKLSFWGVRQS